VFFVDCSLCIHFSGRDAKQAIRGRVRVRLKVTCGLDNRLPCLKRARLLEKAKSQNLSIHPPHRLPSSHPPTPPSSSPRSESALRRKTWFLSLLSARCYVGARPSPRASSACCCHGRSLRKSLPPSTSRRRAARARAQRAQIHFLHRNLLPNLVWSTEEVVRLCCEACWSRGGWLHSVLVGKTSIRLFIEPVTHRRSQHTHTRVAHQESDALGSCKRKNKR